MNYLELSKQIKNCFNGANPSFWDCMSIDGELFRAVKNRRTLRFICNNNAYFIKKHFAVGWYEIIKNLLKFKIPIISAHNEYMAIKKLTALGIHTPLIVGFGTKGCNPATMQSFLITKEVQNIIGMRDIAKKWAQETPNFNTKKNIIAEIARITQKMHANGINHRDLYLAHFLLDKNFQQPNAKIKIYLFDPHRAQIRKHIPQRWLIKDLANLYFSSMEANLTKRDLLRFIQIYFDLPWPKALQQHKKLLAKIETKAKSLYQKREI